MKILLLILGAYVLAIEASQRIPGKSDYNARYCHKHVIRFVVR